MLPTRESLFLGLTVLQAEVNFYEKETSCFEDHSRKSVSFLFEVTICMVPCSEAIGGKQFYPLMSCDPEIISVSKSNIF